MVEGRADGLWDEGSILASVTDECRAAWPLLEPEQAASLIGWVLRPRWQRHRRQRCAELDRLVRLGLVGPGARTGLEPLHPLDYLLDPFVWFGGGRQ